jgi:hypothetical protein
MSRDISLERKDRKNSAIKLVYSIRNPDILAKFQPIPLSTPHQKKKKKNLILAQALHHP